MIDAVQFFSIVASNPVIRSILKATCVHCKNDNKSRLEASLESYVGINKDVCIKCKVTSKFIAGIIKIASKAFGADESKIKERFKDSYWRRGLVNVIKGIATFGVTKPFIPGAPFQIVWNVTKACNLRCKHCYEDAGKIEDQLSTKEAKKAIDRLADFGVVILAFSGGEPLVREDIVDLVRHAKNRGLYVAMATNGTLLTKEKARELKDAGLGFVQISLDGLRDTHNRFRGGDAFERTIEGIKNAVEAGFFVEVATTVTKLNYKEVPKIIELADGLGVNWLMLYNFVPVGRGKDIVELDLSPEEREEILKIAWEENLKRRIGVLSTAPQYARVAIQMQNMCEVVPTHFYNPTLKGKLKTLASFIGGCGAGRFYLAMEPNGDLYPCVFFPRSREVYLGNVLEDDLDEMWRSNEILWKLRNKDVIKSCGSCKFRYVCGGCRARAYNYFGDVLAPDPGCIINKKYYLSLKNNLVKLFLHKRSQET